MYPTPLTIIFRNNLNICFLTHILSIVIILHHLKISYSLWVRYVFTDFLLHLSFTAYSPSFCNAAHSDFNRSNSLGSHSVYNPFTISIQSITFLFNVPINTLSILNTFDIPCSVDIASVIPPNLLNRIFNCFFSVLYLEDTTLWRERATLVVKL